MSFYSVDSISRPSCISLYPALLERTVGLKRYFISLLYVQAVFKNIRSRENESEDKGNTNDLLFNVSTKEQEDMFTQYAYKAYGICLLEILHKQIVLLYALILSNKAACVLKQKKYPAVVHLCNQALRAVDEGSLNILHVTSGSSDREDIYTIQQTYSMHNPSCTAKGDEANVPLAFDRKYVYF